MLLRSKSFFFQIVRNKIATTVTISNLRERNRAPLVSPIYVKTISIVRNYNRAGGNFALSSDSVTTLIWLALKSAYFVANQQFPNTVLLAHSFLSRFLCSIERKSRKNRGFLPSRVYNVFSLSHPSFLNSTHGLRDHYGASPL